MMQQYIKELEQDPFDPEEFVERLAWRTTNDTSKDGTKGSFDPVTIHETFLQAIKDLRILQERQQKKCEKLEAIVKDEEAKHLLEMLELQEKNRNAIDLFHQLDERINFVATKVLHLGDQLESVNIPRARAVEAQKLMRHFSEFLSPGPLMDPAFTDENMLEERADIIQKLHLIAQELPTEKFEHAKKKISAKYDEVERNLIEEFVRAQNLDDVPRMNKLASILSHFKGYNDCMNAFIEESQMSSFNGKDVFQEVVPMCKKNYHLMQQIFINPEQVMAKFVLNIYHLRIQKYVVAKLMDRADQDKYLRNLYDLYSKTVKLSSSLKSFNMGSDDAYLDKLTTNIFQKHLDTYIVVEVRALRDKLSSLLTKYYESKNHQKKPLQSGGFHELKRDIQAAISTRTNLNIAQFEDYGGETFLSEELAIALLQRSKEAFQRCHLLSQPSDLPANAAQIFDVLLHYLINEHVDYALELGLQGIPKPESRNPPEIHFFNLIRQCNVIIRLLEDQFNDSLIPDVISTPKHGDCTSKKKSYLEQMETKLDNGLDRSINAIVNWIKFYLQTEQKKTDFRPETDGNTLNTPACLEVTKYLQETIAKIRDSLDGKSLDSVLTELGIRFHRVIYEHLQQFQFNSAGAMCAICDMNEYRKCVKDLNINVVTTLFDTLHALCNLLLVKPENLKQVCSGDQLAMLDRSVLITFIQLRSDYKTQKLANCLKGLATV